jgi:hypothetical protein
MEIMLNGQLVSCTPKEYKELMDMGLIQNPHATNQVYPGNTPKLPDDIVPLPEGTGNPLPDNIKTERGDVSEWLSNGTRCVPLYGCVQTDTINLAPLEYDGHEIPKVDCVTIPENKTATKEIDDPGFSKTRKDYQDFNKGYQDFIDSLKNKKK